MNLPLTDYSHEMTSWHIPKLNPQDHNRIFKLESIANKNVNRILCSERTNSLRLLSTQDLEERCSMSINKEIYICTSREIQLKTEFISSCSNITVLPNTLVVEEEDDMFLIDSNSDTIPIYCNNEKLHEIKPSKDPVRIKIPPQCHVQSKSLVITKGHFENETHNIQISKRDLNIMPLDIQDWEPFKIQLKDNQGTSNITDKATVPSDDTDLEDEIEEDLKETEADINKTKEGNLSTMDMIVITAISISMVIVTMLVLDKVRKCMRNGRQSKTNDDANQKIAQLESKLQAQQSQINIMQREKTTQITELKTILAEQHQKLTSTKNETITQIITILENNLTNKNQRKTARDLSDFLEKTNLEEES